ncbi:TonB-dependent receptor [Sphingopyxis macrogoltabida]|uniref:TonB-dependent receptor n=1 Tax=Sphingopyxis macrogoltabida TaxID=33050 RepID=A0AAC8YY02_SPHMC|nr:TonB-dependent receptor [Sphingopyxis macrogoltabida]ALJ12099.1 TonB-dependent receptor [Sphingopyxis macrogoltabida]AMU88274.1 TonB-dependent receptor [Sphingopyxis macrogoltabida]
MKIVRLGVLLAATTALSPAVALAQESAATPAAAESDDNGVGDIIVTANRREQSLLSVPIAISAVAGDALASKGITNSANLQDAVPNLQISSPYGNTQPNFSLRGISVANEYNSNQASPIGVYIDDVYMASRTSHGMGLFDLDRVEVLRGPQGTLFGRNTTGGAINFITRGPSLSGSNGYAEAGYGNFNTITAQAAVEATLIEDQLGLRIAGNYLKSDGLIDNVFPGGRDPNRQNTLQGRATLRFNPGGGPLDIKIKAYGGRDHGTQAAIHGLLTARTGLKFFEVNENRIGLNRTDAYGIAATISYELSPSLSFTSITSRDGGSQLIQQAADGAPIDILDVWWKSKYQQFSQEARFNYGADGLNLVGGFFYGWDRVVTDNDFAIGQALGPGVDGGFFQHYRQERRSYAVFAQGDYEIADGLTLTLGARYTWDRSKYRDGFAYLYAGYVDTAKTPIATTVPCAGQPGTCAYDPDARFASNGRDNALTGRVSLSYQFDAGPLVYASYNRGYRSGAFNGGSYTSSGGINYVDPERVNAYEFGAKGRLADNRLTYSAAAFYYDYSKQQLQDLRPGPVGILVNAPKSEVYGAELETNWRASDALTLNLAVGYLHATYKELVLQGADIAGNDLPFAPRWTAQAGADIRLFDTGDAKLTFSPNVAYFSRQFFSPLNEVNAPGTGQQNAELQQGSYAKVNATLALEIGRFTVKGFINNAFNRKTYAYGLDLRGAGFPYPFLVPAAPRTFGGSVRVTF